MSNNTKEFNVEEWNYEMFPFDDFVNLSATAPTVQEEYTPPKALTGDYIEIGYLAVVFAVGFPINLVVFCRQIRDYKNLRRQRFSDVKTAFLLQKICLNFANLIMLIFYCPTMVGWLATYRWLAGDFCCRLVRFLWALSFHLSSNMVAAIAMDRLRNVLYLHSMHTRHDLSNINRNSLKPVKKQIACCWVLSVVCSSPQWLVFCKVDLAPYWAQCTTIWHHRRFQNLANSLYSEHRDMFAQFTDESLYLWAHLITVFWAPFTVVLICYLAIVVTLVRHSCLPAGDIAQLESVAAENEELGVELLSRPSTKQSYISVDVSAARRPSSTIGQFEARMENRACNRRSTVTGMGWRSQLRSNVFRTTILVAIAFCVFWLPYNVFSFMVSLDPVSASVWTDHANWLKGLILLDAVVNPFLYGYHTNRQF